MKKLAVGCAIVLLLMLVASGIASYFVYRQVKGTVTQLAEFSAVPDLDREVRNTASFAPPDSGELTATQVERFVEVQQAVRSRLGTRFAEMETKYRDLADTDSPTAPTLPQIVAAFRDLASTWMEGKRAQVEALNAADLSLDEYGWIKRQAYAALGMLVLDVDVGELVEAMKSGGVGELPAWTTEVLDSSVPEANKQIVEPFSGQLTENVALASLGL